MPSPRRKIAATGAHRGRTRGIKRVELRLRNSDAALVKRIASVLREESPKASRLRTVLEAEARQDSAPKMSFLEYLSTGPWDDEFDKLLVRDKSLPREVEL